MPQAPGADMEQQLWHIAWSTFGEFLPHDRRGRWTALAEFYLPLVTAGSVVSSHPLPSRYLEQSGNAIALANADATQLREWLTELTRAATAATALPALTRYRPLRSGRR